jgi:hypothetical protein
VGDDLSDERCERPVWDYDRAFVGPDDHFVKGYYPAHDPESLPSELREPFVQYNIPAMLALGSGWPSRTWEDLVPMTTEVRSGSSYRFAGSHTPSCGKHSPEYHGALAAADFSQCMLKVAAGVYAGFYETQPFAIMKLNGRKNVPKKDALGNLTDVRWCVNHSSPFGDSVNDSSPAQFQVFTPITTAPRMAGIAADVCESVADPSIVVEDWCDAYQSVGIHPRDFWLNGFRVWHPDKAKFVYFISKVMNFGGVGSGNAFGRVALFVVWQLSVCGWLSELCVDDLAVLGSRKQVGVAQHFLHMIADVLEFSWKSAKRVTPTAVATYNGFVWDLGTRQMRLTPAFLAKINRVIDSAGWLSKHRQSRKAVESMIGLLARACMAIYFGKLFIFHLRKALRDSGGSEWISISPAAREEISFFRYLIPRWNGLRSFPCALASRPSLPVGQCDACEAGLGGVWFEGNICYWFYHKFNSPRSLSWENCARECLGMATFVRLYSFAHPTCKSFLLQSDNSATVDTWNAKSPGCGEGLLHGLRAAASVATLLDLDIILAHLPGKLNVFADAVSRANWPVFFDLTSSFRCIRIPIPQDWQRDWL